MLQLVQSLLWVGKAKQGKKEAMVFCFFFPHNVIEYVLYIFMMENVCSHTAPIGYTVLNNC